MQCFANNIERNMIFLNILITLNNENVVKFNIYVEFMYNVDQQNVEEYSSCTFTIKMAK